MRVAIVGAGTAGLCAARHSLANGFEVTVFEHAPGIGGTWRYTDEVGLDKYGFNVSTALYKNLRTNLPKEIMGFPDFPFGEEEKSHIRAEKVLDHLHRYAAAFHIDDSILKLQHYVQDIRPINDSSWQIKYKDLLKDIEHVEIYDAVLLCNGHYCFPNIPTYPGMDLFQGKQMHSHDFRNIQTYQGKGVLIIGSGPSGIDISVEISKSASKVAISQRSVKNPPKKYPSKINVRPDVIELTEAGVKYEDGTEENFDVIIYCTGYKTKFPFLNDDCKITVEDNYVRSLFKHCVNINYPTMAFIGLPFYCLITHMIDLQVRFFMNVLNGTVTLPTKEEMSIDTDVEMAERWKSGLRTKCAHMLYYRQKTYFDDLSELGKVENIKPVYLNIITSTHTRFWDIENYRKYNFKVLDDESFVESICE